MNLGEISMGLRLLLEQPAAALGAPTGLQSLLASTLHRDSVSLSVEDLAFLYLI